MGSAALYHLARRGVKALGLEQYEIAHDRGSSHGQTRIIRKLYSEGLLYVPLATRAFELWREIEAAWGRRLLEPTGMLLVGPPEGSLISGAEAAAARHHLDVERISLDEFWRRFPDFTAGEGMKVLLDREAGFLRVEECVRAQAELARRAGAVIRTGEAVQSWSAGPDGVEVRTPRGSHSAGRLVLCAGAWSGSLLGELGLRLKVLRKVVLWFHAPEGSYRAELGCPVFCFETLGGWFYGFPVVDGNGLKAAEHSGGETVTRPDLVDRSLHPEDVVRVRQFLQRHLPKAGDAVRKHSVCMYTMTRDERFIIDRHPGHPNVLVAAGFSGHGFKFAPVVGRILADLVLRGGTAEPIEPFSIQRPSLHC